MPGSRPNKNGMKFRKSTPLVPTPFRPFPNASDAEVGELLGVAGHGLEVYIYIYIYIYICIIYMLCVYIYIYIYMYIYMYYIYIYIYMLYVYIYIYIHIHIYIYMYICIYTHLFVCLLISVVMPDVVLHDLRLYDYAFCVYCLVVLSVRFMHRFICSLWFFCGYDHLCCLLRHFCVYVCLCVSLMYFPGEIKREHESHDDPTD